MSSKFSSLSLMVVLATALTACDGRKGPSGGDEGLYGGAEDVTYVANSTFRVESVDISQTSVQSIDDFGLPKFKKFQFKACITNSVNQSPVNQVRFGVSDGKSERILRTQGDGCLLWDEVHKISALQKERLLHFQRHFRGVDGYTGNVTVDLAINPWEESPTLYDLRRYTPPDLDSGLENLGFESDMLNLGLGPANAAGSAEAFLADVSMEFTGHDKSQTIITPLLTLKPVQKFRLRLEPKFIRRNLKNELVRMDLKGGEFKLRFVVLRDGSQDDPKPQDLVAEYQGDIKVLYDGTATQDILLRIHDTSKILSRNRAVIILEPIGEAARVARVGVYSGFIGALTGGDADVRLVSAEEKGSLVGARITNLLGQVSEKRDALTVFKENAQLAERNDLLDLAKGGESAIGFSPYGSATGSGIPKLCAVVYLPTDKVKVERWIFGGAKEKPAIEECSRNPRKYLGIGTYDFVQELKGDIRNVPELTSVSARKIEISRSLSWRKESSTSMGGKISGSFDPLGLLTDFLGIKIGIGSEVYAAAELSKSTSRGVEASVSESQSFSVVRDAYEITALTKNCIAVQGVIEGRGFFACADKTEEKTFVERYYLVNYDVESSPFADEGADNQWRLTIRGEAKYKEFERVLTSDNSLLTLMKLHVLPEMDKALVPDFRVNQVYPGVLSK